MSDVNHFPSNATEALAILYCQKHSTSETTPAELKEMYYQAKKEIANTKIDRSKVQKL